MTGYSPSDLRIVDPRPTRRVLDVEEAIVRELLTSRLTGGELTDALRALGLQSDGHDTRSSSRQRRDGDPRLTRNQTHCKRGHDRAKYTTENRAGVAYCLACKAADGERRSAAAAERRKEAA